MRRTFYICMVLGTALVSSCTSQTESIQATPDGECAPATLTGDAVPAGSGSGSPAAERQVTFYGDLLPILRENKRGRSFKCTTCHNHYTTPEGLNNVPEIDSIVRSLESGRMPRSSDRVPQKEIDLFRAWQFQGFQPGDPDAPPSGQVSGSGSGQDETPGQSADAVKADAVKCREARN